MRLVHPQPARRDVTSNGGAVDSIGDTLHGEAGDDRFHTRDGEVDTIDCGAGQDVALLDGVDVIADATAENPNGSCEKVVRRAPRAGEDAPENATQSPAEDNAHA